MVTHRPSPAERFRDELGHRLSVDAHLNLPSANILVGVIIDALDALEQRSTVLSLITLRNVMCVSNEVLALGCLLAIPDPESYGSQDPADIPLRVLQDLQLLCLPRTCLNTQTCPSALLKRSTVLRTYLSIARDLSSYIGPRGVRDLIQDFNRPTPDQFLITEGYTRRVPGVGPRSVKVRREERRRVDPTMFSPVVKKEIKEEVERWAPPPYQRNSRGWPVLRKMERERHTFEDGLDKWIGSRKEEFKSGGWKSLRLKFKRFSW